MNNGEREAYEKEIEYLKKLVAQQERKLSENENRIAMLSEQLAGLRRRFFGPRSERTKTVLPDSAQMSLFNEAELEGTEAIPEEKPADSSHVKAHSRKKKDSRKLDLTGMETETVVHDIPEGHLSCPECGSRDMVCIGENLVRYELHVVPASYTVKKHVQKVYKCLSCSDDEHTAIIKAPAPNALVSHSPVTASSMTMTLLNKFQFALPFNRQEKLWKMMGIAVSKATMANWILYAYRDWLKPLLGLMKEQLLEETVIHADETRVQVMKEKGRRNTSQSYMWLYSTGGFAKTQIRLFEYQPSRSGDCAADFLKDFKGYLHTDAYSGYGKVSEAKHCFCYAHARRKFVDSLPPGTADSGDTVAGKAIKQINGLFKLEQRYADMDADERQKQRQAEARPRILALFEYLESNLDRFTQSSAIAKAMKYMLNNRTSFMNYLEDGNCSISNNIAEYSIRPFTIGRKNWVLSGSPRGAEASAGVYSMIETCLANGIDTRDYFMYIFEHMPQEENIHDRNVLQKYLPWNVPIENTNK